jgi:F-type H+-transporting ATPase subunit a
MHVSLAAEPIFKIGSFGVNNALLTSWLVVIILSVLAYFGGRGTKMIPGKMQNFFEAIIEGLFNFFDSIWEDRKKTQKYFSLLATFFIFIMFSNWFGLLPGIGSIGFREGEAGHEKFIPLFRSVNSDLNATLSWALISVVLVQFFGVATLGRDYLKKFINFKSPIDFFMGILEIVSEAAKIVSFSFRLFGNVFAGEVLLVVITSIAPFLVPLPFYGMELFVGVVQALVFTMLSLFFIKMATEAHH